MKKISEQQFYDLLSLKLSGDADARELALLEEQLQANPHWQLLYDQMMQNPFASSRLEEYTRQAYAAHFVKMQLQGKFEEKPKVYSPAGSNRPDVQNLSFRSMRKWLFPLLAAASLTGLLFLVRPFFLNKSAVREINALNEIVTRKGSKSNIKLPDGTRVWLNADSKLIYGELFIGNTREVTLSGEAYFDVSHNSARPFIIHTGNADIRVLGTAFNVRNYPEDKTWETTLMRGKIEVSLVDKPNEKIVLKPLQKLIVPKETSSLEGSATTAISTGHATSKATLTGVSYSFKDSLVAETSWMNNKLVFLGQPLEKIAEELERQFAVTVIFKTEAVKNYRYTGDFEKAGLEKILQIISMTKKINYSISDSTVIIE